jgi:hypothetical protein
LQPCSSYFGAPRSRSTQAVKKGGWIAFLGFTQSVAVTEGAGINSRN